MGRWTTPVPGGGGTGLGLATGREIATHHGGTLRVVEGARFVLRLPLAPSGG